MKKAEHEDEIKMNPFRQSGSTSHSSDSNSTLRENNVSVGPQEAAAAPSRPPDGLELGQIETLFIC